jgi:integrase
VPAFGRVRLDKLTPVRIQSGITDLLDKGVSARTAQYAHAVLRVALQNAVQMGVLRDNPAARVKPPRPRREPLRTVSIIEARKLLEQARSEPLGALWVLALTTGMRQGELLGLQWRDVDLDLGSVRVREGKTLRSRRVLPLARVAIELLGEPGEPDGLVFPSEVGTPLNRRSVLRRWHEFSERVLGRRTRFHELRVRHEAPCCRVG